jgi:transcription initiation factor TFIIE subunit alpha
MEFLKIVEEFVFEIGGKEAIKILSLLKDRDNLSEFDIADEIKLSINQVRNLLYKLGSHNLVYSNRKKDREKGWYIYYWTFNFKHARDLLILEKKRKLEQLKQEINNEKHFFICSNGCVRFDYEDALESEYKCPECGNILNQEDFNKRATEINNQIHLLEAESQELEKPLTLLPKAEEVDERIKKTRKRLKKIKKKQKKILKKAIKKRKKVKKAAKKIKKKSKKRK